MTYACTGRCKHCSEGDHTSCGERIDPAAAADAGIEVKPQSLPYTLIADGYLYAENLSLAGKDRGWLDKTLLEHKTTQKSTWLLTVDGRDKVLFIRKEAKK